ncbi:hypothetical protein HPB47_002425 [Ixodes persulcatus]|uniref:Uncharacterized protein n=1 Tax=Ixodes persulcatus TaxID=34615 RepID=A0AC60PM72_IXOPE|nr:hypothetical protein HPB47_002425 [Ixodes persulcatus]
MTRSPSESQREEKVTPMQKIDTSEWCTADQEVVAARLALSNVKKRVLIVSAYMRGNDKRNFAWILQFKRRYLNDYILMGGALNVYLERWYDGKVATVHDPAQ